MAAIFLYLVCVNLAAAEVHLKKVDKRSLWTEHNPGGLTYQMIAGPYFSVALETTVKREAERFIRANYRDFRYVDMTDRVYQSFNRSHRKNIKLENIDEINFPGISRLKGKVFDLVSSGDGFEARIHYDGENWSIVFGSKVSLRKDAGVSPWVINRIRTLIDNRTIGKQSHKFKSCYKTGSLSEALALVSLSEDPQRWNPILFKGTEMDIISVINVPACYRRMFG